MKDENIEKGFSPFLIMLPSYMIDIDVDKQWTDEEFVKMAVEESWNIDEYSDEGYAALKRMLLRLTIPKDKWETTDKKEFYKVLLDKYKKIKNE